jgi:hypothetical protein
MSMSSLCIAGVLACPLLLGCGARTSPLSEDPVDGTVIDDGLDGGATGGDGQCVRCDTYAECSHCLVQGHDSSYRCPVEAPAPESSCTNLLERFMGDDGRMYTCFYCGTL